MFQNFTGLRKYDYNLKGRREKKKIEFKHQYWREMSESLLELQQSQSRKTSLTVTLQPLTATAEFQGNFCRGVAPFLTTSGAEEGRVGGARR